MTAGSIAVLGAALVVGYLLGSMPFGLLLTRLAGLGDIRAIGSGNIGATNVLRTGNRGLAAATLILDGAKGTLAVLLCARFGADAEIAAALGAFVGHLFPVWLGFKGGKGVATYIGLLAALFWPAALLFCALWLATAFISRLSSLSALVASLVTPFALLVMPGWHLALLFALLSVLLWWRHRDNLARLMAGTETRIGEKRS
jgi:glycerol-3-phosphate acyltransferase PlsY